jgi:hypothetical protein
MTSRSERLASSPWWGAQRRTNRGLLQDLLGGALLLAVWVLLWSFFAVAVLEPAARLHGRGGGAAVEIRDAA